MEERLIGNLEGIFMFRFVARTVGVSILFLLPSLSLGQAPGETGKARTMSKTVQTENRVFQLTVTEAPGDPRDGEEVEFALKLTERVEGGFAGGDIPVENAQLRAQILVADGDPVA